MRYILTTLLIALFSVFNHLEAQQHFPYEVSTEAEEIPQLPGLHSFAMAHHGNKVLIMAGRRDGLHARQPFNTFPRVSSNDSIYVLDLEKKKVSSAGISSLAKNVQEQLLSTNINFCQVSDTLYLIGGYGYSDAALDHITFQYLTTVEVSAVINAIENNGEFKQYIKQGSDSRLQNTGGQLAYLDGFFYLVGGQVFTGRYNPMGHNTYVQSYVTKLQKFKVNSGTHTPSMHSYTSVQNDVHLHRRDYNLLPQIFPDGGKGFMISSGVFQQSVDLPFLYPVDIKGLTPTPRTEFNQFLSHYHSAKTALFDSTNRNMYSLFLGGMSQYYYSDTNLVKDDGVPFVKTISIVERNSNNELSEYRLKNELANLRGASAEFLLASNTPHTDEGVILMNRLDDSQDSILIGFIIGGISSTSLNPFSRNQTSTNTEATKGIIKVYLKRKTTGNLVKVRALPQFTVTVQSPVQSGELQISVKAPDQGELMGMITNEQGQIIHRLGIERISAGSSNHKIPVNLAAGTYHITLTLNKLQYATSTFVVAR